MELSEKINRYERMNEEEISMRSFHLTDLVIVIILYICSTDPLWEALTAVLPLGPPTYGEATAAGWPTHHSVQDQTCNLPPRVPVR